MSNYDCTIWWDIQILPKMYLCIFPFKMSSQTYFMKTNVNIKGLKMKR